MLEYAAADTRYLPQLRDLLREQLAGAGPARAGRRRSSHYWSGIRADRPGRGRAGLAPGERGEGAAREGARRASGSCGSGATAAARRADRATFRILNNEPMLAMAKNPPTDLAALKAIPGVSSDQAERRGRDILAAVRRGLELPETDLPRLTARRAGCRTRPTRSGSSDSRPPATSWRRVRPGTGRGLSQRDAGGHRPAGPEDDGRAGRRDRAAAMAAAGVRRGVVQGAARHGRGGRRGLVRTRERRVPGGPSARESSTDPTPARPRRSAPPRGLPSPVAHPR